ncbi:hypothetical protein GGS26DRAFT_545143 [Hypomontagnella submonticulosa]|nr:hypothetical protein GGS26DRAFT_545143 [Hypomontagnella submonticulosa]
MGGIIYHHENHYFPLTAFQIAGARLEDPEITLAEVQDKSKRDWFAKIVAILQSSQLVLSLIVRTAQGLDFSQLETITLGLAVCGALINLLYIYKPHNISTPYKLRRVKQMGKWVDLKPGEPTENGLQPLEFRWTYESFWNVLRNRPMDQGTMDDVPRIPNDNIPISQNRVAHPAIFLLAVLSGLFGALHAIAWNFEFPTRVERIFWQIATSVSIVSPVIGLIAIPPLQRTRSWGNPQNFNNRCVQLFDECLATGISAVEGGFDDRKQRAMADAVTAARDALQSTYKKNLRSNKKREYRPFQEVLKRLFEKPTPDQPRRHIDTVLLVLEERVRRTRAGGDDLEISRVSEFQRQFRSLVSIIDRDGDASKRLSDEAKTNIFPRRTTLPPWLSLFVFLPTSLLYFFSRLSLLAISLSALRQMPESVYVNTAWTAYIPNIGSST